MEKVTVLIPTLNSMAYMSECLESVMNQSLQELEIMVIDAGSTDGTLECVKRYQEKDKRIQVVHSERKSYGYQINLGIRLAKGIYIGVVESDDLIEKDMYETLMKTAEETDADFVKGGFYNYAVTEDKQEMKISENISVKGIMGKVINPSDYKFLYWEDIYLWRGIYKKDFLKSKEIALNESAGAAYQDVGFLLQVFMYAEKAVYLEKCFYMYRRNNMNSSTYNEKAFSYLAGEYKYILNHLGGCDEIKKSWSSYFYCRLFKQCIPRFRLLAYHQIDVKAAEEDIIYLQRLLKDALENKNIDISVWDTRFATELFMFLDSISSYANYYKIHVSAQKRYLEELRKEISSFSHVVLVSDTKVQPFVYALLKKQNVNLPLSICDNDSKKWGMERMGKKIISVECACEDKETKAYIIANPRAKRELTQQLYSLGVPDKQIFIFDLSCDWLFLS